MATRMTGERPTMNTTVCPWCNGTGAGGDCEEGCRRPSSRCAGTAQGNGEIEAVAVPDDDETANRERIWRENADDRDVVDDESMAQTDDDEPEDDDPRCTNCGIYRSEHAGLARDCDGFTTKPGGFIVYTSDDLAEMTFEERAELFGWDDRDDDPDDDEVPF